jgi:hypothetical protein
MFAVAVESAARPPDDEAPLVAAKSAFLAGDWHFFATPKGCHLPSPWLAAQLAAEEARVNETSGRADCGHRVRDGEITVVQVGGHHIGPPPLDCRHCAGWPTSTDGCYRCADPEDVVVAAVRGDALVIAGLCSTCATDELWYDLDALEWHSILGDDHAFAR